MFVFGCMFVCLCVGVCSRVCAGVCVWKCECFCCVPGFYCVRAGFFFVSVPGFVFPRSECVFVLRGEIWVGVLGVKDFTLR